MQRVGRDISSRDRWSDLASSYADNIEGHYHKLRARAVARLLPDLKGGTVLDFGCGEGVFSRAAEMDGAAHIIGVDPVVELVEIARRAQPNATFLVGDVYDLKTVPNESVDCLLALNVIAYLDTVEEPHFYKEAWRIMKPGGSLVVTHSNSLFDMFTFNKYTIDFYQSNFGCDVSSLIVNPDLPKRTTFSVRENALNYSYKMQGLGFMEVAQEFLNYHPVPPLLAREDPDDMLRQRPDTDDIPPSERWKLPFQCSMFGSRCVKKPD